MFVTFEEICEKEIINILDGSSLGFVGDILFDTETRKINALIIKQKPRFFGFLKNEADLSIGWDKIEAVGKDTILVKIKECGRIHNEKQNLIQKFLNIFFY